MSNAEELLEKLRKAKAKANLKCAQENVDKTFQASELAREELKVAQKTHHDAMEAIDLAALQ